MVYVTEQPEEGDLIGTVFTGIRRRDVPHGRSRLFAGAY